MKTVRLSDIALINPRPSRLAADVPTSFVGMAQLDDVSAKALPQSTRPFGDVAKGYTIFRNRDLLVAKITPCFENGKIGQAYLDHEVGVGSTEFHVVRPAELVNERYLLHFLRSPEVRRVGALRMTGSGGQRRVPSAFLETLSVPLPQIEEQRRIAAILDQASLLLGGRRSELTAFDEARVDAFYAHFAGEDGGLDFVGARVLADWVDPARPITYGILMPGPHVDCGVPYVRVADVKDRRINLKTIRSTTAVIESAYARSRLRSGDLVMSIRGHVGRLASVPSQLEGANITQDSARISIGDRSRSIYIRAVLESVELQEWMRRHTKGAAVRGINLADVRNAPIPEADPHKIRTFAEVVTAIDAQRDRIQRAIDLHDELFASLQSRAFKGEL